MRTMTKEDVLPELEETVFALVRKVGVLGNTSRKGALEVVASALRAMTEEIEGRANGTKPDERE